MTRTITTLFATMAATLGILGSAFAADMTGADIKAFLSGKTSYLETTAASASGKAGQGMIYWAEDGTALYKTPSGAIMTWHMDDKRRSALSGLERTAEQCLRQIRQGRRQGDRSRSCFRRVARNDREDSTGQRREDCALTRRD
jgi:hypothetical protein